LNYFLKNELIQETRIITPQACQNVKIGAFDQNNGASQFHNIINIQPLNAPNKIQINNVMKQLAKILDEL
jgi:hypothetical protein